MTRPQLSSAAIVVAVAGWGLLVAFLWSRLPRRRRRVVEDASQSRRARFAAWRILASATADEVDAVQDPVPGHQLGCRCAGTDGCWDRMVTQMGLRLAAELERQVREDTS